MSNSRGSTDELVVVALGGNAILKPNQQGTIDQQLSNIKTTCRQLGELIIQDGYKMVLTHGNGPQVGNILLQNETANDKVPPMPLDVCGAESQGLIGYLIARELINVLNKAKVEDILVTTVISQTLVSVDDPAFGHPTKPVGPFYTSKQAERLKEEKGYTIVNDSNRGWRRVVPSPDPVKILESPAIKKLVDQGVIVIASGGGGVPVTREEGELIGQEAVIDKDLAAARLACDLEAELFLILTDVQQVMLNYGTENEKGIDHMSVEEANKYMEDGHFPEGSMKPKVKACIQFIEHGGERAIITSLDLVKEGLLGVAGTTIR